ncbi:hypothetical protein UFOVP1326_40 [uncultured Caudovirales phage]|uniref:Uncharacterized protein n=1 Tax=uncultured Caudovirales phage TaxID=2100421 RepID=A0A6J5S253_9CAUD|nr:hypothetical protein UFOVP1326_40 [uncultured Caudovirales phage]CAB4212988.1 hypothetical protein UFOVP1436_51 [uncultured Caudovirales phage]
MLYPSVKSPDQRRWQQAMLANNFGTVGSSVVPPSFSATLLSTLVPQVFTGSSTPTFTRATTAYVTDFEGLLKQVPSGCARFTGARFVRNMLAIASNDATALTSFGGASTMTATTMEATGANAIRYDGTFTAGWAGTGRCRIKLTAISVAPSVQISCDGGTSYTAVTVTSTPQVFSVLTTQATAIIGSLAIKLVNIGDKISIEEMMVENTTGQSNTNPSEYVSKGVLSAPYHGAGVDGVKYFTTQNGNTVASNVVTEATGAAISSATLLGYQAEGARTNLCLQSQTLGTTWATGGALAPVVADQYVAPDGTTTVDKLITTAATNAFYLQQDFAAIAGTTFTYSVYLRYVNNRWANLAFWDGTTVYYASFDVLNGVVGVKAAGISSTTMTATGVSGVYRATMTLTPGVSQVNRVYIALMNADSSAGFSTFAAAGTEAMGAWGGQLEIASFASSYIPTTTVAVARNQDLLSYVAASNIDTATGTMYAEAKLAAGINSTFPVIIGGGNGNPRFYINAVNTVVANDTTNNTSTSGTGLSYVTAPRKAAMNWGGATMAISKDGAAAVSGSFDGVIEATAISIGNAVSSSYDLFGTVRNVVIYTTKKTNAELAALTA